MSQPTAPMGSPNPYVMPALQKNKNWFVRHKILSAVLAVIVVIIIGAAIGGSGDQQDSTASTSEQTSATENASEATSEENATEAQTTADPEETSQTQESSAEAQLPGLNTTVTVGVFEVTVTGVESGIGSIGEDFMKIDAQGQFVRVALTVKNTSDKGEYFDTSEQHLVDDSGRQHDYSSDAAFSDSSLIFDKINPGNLIEGFIVYDIPTDAVPVAVDFVESFLDDKPVRVNLK